MDFSECQAAFRKLQLGMRDTDVYKMTCARWTHHSTTTLHGNSEQWVYDAYYDGTYFYGYLYFEDHVLVAIQN